MTEYEKPFADLVQRNKDMKKVYDARPTVGRRFSVPREGAEPVDVLLHLPRTAGPHPVLFNMHGGGFSGLDAVCLDDFCQMLCDTLGLFVVNVNYKLSPAVAYPYAIREVCAAADYFRGHAAEYDLDVTRFAVGGFSAGGSLAAGAALLGRDEGHPFAAQLLIYPCTDLYTALSDPEGATEMRSCTEMYCQHNDSRDLYASPLLAEDEQLADVCPALVLTCGPDSLREQGEAYAKRLVDLGVPVIFRRYQTAQHGFIEVNRACYFFDKDERITPEQAALARQAEAFLRAGLKLMLGL